MRAFYILLQSIIESIQSYNAGSEECVCLVERPMKMLGANNTLTATLME